MGLPGCAFLVPRANEPHRCRARYEYCAGLYQYLPPDKYQALWHTAGLLGLPGRTSKAADDPHDMSDSLFASLFRKLSSNCFIRHVLSQLILVGTIA